MKQDYTVDVVDGVACFRFFDIIKMAVMFEPVSMFVEGKTSTPRIGHNFSMSLLKEYSKLRTKKERELVSFMAKNSMMKDVKYIIAYLDGDVITKRHELQHARFYIDHCFKKKVEDAWFKMDARKRQHIEGFLTRLGYPDHVWIDEFQAYYLTEKPNFFGIRLDVVLT
jgi:hypothetical protein